MIILNYCIENINNIQHINEDYLIIKQQKQQLINKLKNLDDKKRSILGEKLLIYGLRKFYNVDYNDIVINLNDEGKPYINNRDFDYIKYNISHSYDYVICAFSDKEIGVDIEKIREININIINKFATSNEIKYILSNKKQILNRLFTIYALKESYFKMLGTNLNNIQNIEFTIKNGNITCSDSKTKFQIIKSIKGYIISICERV